MKNAKFWTFFNIHFFIFGQILKLILVFITNQWNFFWNFYDPPKIFQKGYPPPQLLDVLMHVDDPLPERSKLKLSTERRLACFGNDSVLAEGPSRPVDQVFQNSKRVQRKPGRSSLSRRCRRWSCSNRSCRTQVERFKNNFDISPRQTRTNQYASESVLYDFICVMLIYLFRAILLVPASSDTKSIRLLDVSESWLIKMVRWDLVGTRQDLKFGCRRQIKVLGFLNLRILKRIPKLYFL